MQVPFKVVACRVSIWGERNGSYMGRKCLMSSMNFNISQCAMLNTEQTGKVQLTDGLHTCVAAKR